MMTVTTNIDLSVNAYRFFLHEAEKTGTTPEELISNYLESYAVLEIANQNTEKE